MISESLIFISRVNLIKTLIFYYFSWDVFDNEQKLLNQIL